MATVISGSLAHDYIMDFPDKFRNHILPEKLHILNVCFVVNKLRKSFGGTAGNIAYTLRLLGSEPLIVSGIGRDGAEYLAHLRKHGIRTKYIGLDRDTLTCSAFITTDEDDNQVTAFYGGPVPKNVPALKRVKERFSFAIISPPNNLEIARRHMAEGAELGLKLIFDPGQNVAHFRPAELRKMIARSRMVIGNDYEMAVLVKRTGWSVPRLAAKTEVLITTLGEKGSLLQTRKGESIKIASCPPAKLTDPTGAGDAFRAGFLAGLEKNYALKTCARMGSVAASFAIEKYGTQEHAFCRAEFCKRYKSTYNESLKL